MPRSTTFSAKDITVLDSKTMIAIHNMWLKQLGCAESDIPHAPASIKWVLDRHDVQVRAEVLTEVVKMIEGNDHIDRRHRRLIESIRTLVFK